MIHITMLFEDTTLVATLDQTGAQNEWKGFVGDNLTGKQVPVSFSPDEMTAITALMVHNDGMPLDNETTNRFYEFAEPARERNGLKDSLRLIP